MRIILTILILISSYSYGATNDFLKSIDPLVLEKLKETKPRLLKPPFTQKRLDLLLKEIHKFSGAKNVSYSQDKNKISFKLEKPPKISAIEINGVNTSDQDSILRFIPAKLNGPLKKELIQNSAIAIKKFYMQESYFNAEVSIEAKKLDSENSKLKIEIKKNNAVSISKIEILSNNEDLNKRLTDELDNFKDSKLSLEILDNIRTKSENYLQENRYLQAGVSEPRYKIINQEDGSAEVSIDVSRPKKYELSFYGNLEISKNEILRKLDLDNTSSRFGLDVKNELINRTKAIYRAQAYPKAEINIKEKTENNKILLQIDINEGPEVRIVRWRLRGSFGRDEQYYIDQIQKLGSSQIRSENYVDKELKEVVNSLNVDLQNQGYLSSKAELEKVRWVKSDAVEIFLFLDEGVLTKLKSIDFEGLTAFPKEKLLDLIELNEGDPLNLLQIEKSLERIRTLYMNNAYLDFTVSNSGKELIEYSDENKKARLIYKLDEGDKIKVKSIIVSGTQLTKESIVTRSLDFEVGDYLTLERIRESEAQLQKLGLFSRADIQALPANTGNRPVLIKVSERSPGVFTFGLGVSDELNGTLKGFTGVLYKNLGGSAKVVQARAEIQKKFQETNFIENKVTLSYLEPFLFGEKLKGRTNLSFSQEFDFLTSDNSSNTYIKETREINFNIEKDFSRHFKFGWRLWGISGTRRFELNRNDDQEKLQVASLGPYIEYDRRDHPFTPKKGVYSQLNVEFASPNLESSDDIHFIRATGAFNHYIPLTEDNYFVLAYSLRGGFVENLGKPGTLSIPQEKMFFLGGRSTLRGFELSEIPSTTEISALKPSGKTSYFVTDKSSFGLIKIELRFPIYKDFGAALFYDGGMVDIPEVDIEDKFRHSAGIGFRWYTPVGPVSLEYGLKLDKKDAETDGRVHFAIGAF